MKTPSKHPPHSNNGTRSSVFDMATYAACWSSKAIAGILLLTLGLFTTISVPVYAQSWAARSITDNFTGSNFSAYRFRNCGGVFFFAGGSNGISNAEAWVSRGTATSTRPLSHYNPEATIPTDPQEFTKVGNYVYFAASDPLNGRELWRVNLANFALNLVKNIRPTSASSSPHSLAECNGKLLFVCNSDNSVAIGDELWASDGTESGTLLLKDIIPGKGNSGIDGEITTLGGVAYFDANSTTGSGSHPWRSDGTAVGTYRLIDPGTSYSYPGGFTSFKGATYFLMKDSTSGSDFALWKTTGTTGGTTRVKTKVADRWDYMVQTSTHLYFRGYSSTAGVELWKSDGTSAGTVMVKDVQTGTGSGMDSYYGSPSELAVLGNSVVFVGNDGIRGKQIWKSDGTAGGTVLVQEVSNLAGKPAPVPNGVIAFSGQVFFRMTRDSYGTEWWSTNGTSISATPAADVYPGATSGIRAYRYTYSGEQIVSGSHLYFVGTDAELGQELWRIGPPLSITTQPQSRLVAKGAATSLSVAVSSTAGIEYTWRKNGTTLAGAVSSSYSISSASLTDAGNYQVIAEGDDGTATSAVAKLGVVDTNVAPKSAVAGGSVSLSVATAAPSGTTFTYSWKRGGSTLTNGGVISGATGPTITISKLSAAETGSYTCVVAMGTLSVTTQPAAVTLAVLPVINTQPQSRLVKSGTNVTFSVIAADTASLTYQWKWNGANIAGATAASYTLPNTQLSNAGEYRCTLTNPGGSVNSGVARLGVVSESLTGTDLINLLAGGTLNAAAGLAAPGTATLTYQWRKNTVAVANGTNASGSTYGGAQSNTFSISNTQLSDAGFYSCTVGMDTLTLTVGKFDLIVKSKPVITTTTVPSAVISGPYTWQIVCIGGATAYQITGLPSGLRYDKGNGLIFGTPLVSGEFRVKVIAINEVGSSSPTYFTLIVPRLETVKVGSLSATISGSRAINGKLGGKLALTVTSAGTYSGTVTNGLSVYRVTGRVIAGVNADCQISLLLRRTGLFDLALDLTLQSGSRLISGTLSDGVDSATISGGIHDWSTRSPAENYAGTFNVTDNFRSAYTDVIYPRGRGWLRVKVNPQGSISGGGRNIEGLAYTFSSFLWFDGRFGFFVPIHKGRGSMVGQPLISLGATTDASDDRLTAGTGGYAYFKMPSTNPADRLYPVGFEVLDAQWAGSRWFGVPKGQTAFGWNSVPNNARAYFTRGGLDLSFQYPLIDRMPFLLLPSGAASYSASGGNPCKVTFRMDPATGMYSGTLRLEDPVVPGATMTYVRNLTYTGLMINYLSTGYGGISVPQLPTQGQTLLTSPIITGRADVIRY